MVRIEHLAIWVEDLELMKEFYETFFNAKAGKEYYNPNKSFTSYFLNFEEGCRLELMHRPDIKKREGFNELIGITHFALAVGSKGKVDKLTERLRAKDYEIAGEPRTTGDGYYESIVLDPEGNRIEITV